MKFPATFRQALVLHSIAVAVLPILLLGLFSYQYFTNKHIDTITSLLDTHADNVSNEASEFLSDTSSLLFMLKEMVEGSPLHGEEMISRHLQMALEGSGSFESIYVLDENYKIIHLGLAAKNVRKIEDYMGMDMSGHQLFADYTTGGHHIMNGPAWSDTFISTISAEPSITLGLPFENGTLMGTVSLQRLSKNLVQRLGALSRGFRFSILDHHGTIVADSRVEVIAHRLNLRLHPEVGDALDYKVEVSGKYHEDHSLLESVRVIPETNWVAYVSLPVEEALQEVRPLHYLMIFVLTFALLMAALLSYWLSRHIIKPLIGLGEATADVANGKYDRSLPKVRYDELNNLSNSFREMISAVEDREKSLLETQQLYRELVNSIDGIVWELDPVSFRYTFVSDQAEKILGYPARRWLHEESFWQDHIHDDDRDWVVSFCSMETEALRDHDFEYRMIAEDGRVIWLKDLVSVTVEDGRPVRLSGVMLDITKRKTAEMELLVAADRMQILIDRMPFGCIMRDADNNVELWNAAAERIFGFTEEEVLGRHPVDFLIPDSSKEHVEKVYSLLDAGTPLAHSINENVTKDGRIITCEWHNTPLQNPDGSKGGAISMVDDISQRVNAETALKESEALFRTVFDINPDAVLISRLTDGKILSANEYSLKVSGYTLDEMVGKTSLELGLWNDETQREHYMNVVREDGFIENFEMRLRVKNGRERIGLASARTLVLNDEMCTLNVIRDITEIKEAERRMSRSEERFRSLVSVMGEGLLILGFNGEIVQCNMAAERILKQPADELIGTLHTEMDHNAIREDGELYADDEHPAVYTLTTGKPVVNRIMGLPQDNGSIVWLQVNTHALGLDVHGKPVAVVVSFADVSSLKTIENELRDNERHLQALSRQFQGVLEAIPDRILILDNNMKVVWLNWPEELIDPEQDLASQDLRCYQLPGVNCGPSANLGSPLCDHCPVKKTFETGRTELMQKELSDGRTLSLRTFPIFNEQGVVVNVIEIAQDISESLQQQEQALRAGQLAALGELAAGVAHEINNPINGVINYAQLILNKAVEDSREQELSKRIIRESERIATIVRELLYFSREESAEVATVTIKSALEEALSLTSHQMDKEGIILQVDLPDDLPMITSYSHQIPRLFLNLISNARHALNRKYPDRSPEKVLQISGHRDISSEDDRVIVIFRDQGTGIPKDLVEKVMNPFVTTKPSAEGTGLGLSISHEIVQKHNGRLSIESEFGDFTIVTVELPVEHSGS